MHVRHVMAAVALSAATVTTGTLTPAGAAPSAAQLQWHPCRGSLGGAAQCAELSVPLDYSDPGGRHITIAVSRVRHTSSPQDYEGVIVVNPGGPGGAGLSLSTLGQYVPRDVGSRYDWIGFDPRGVGRSEPSMHCIPHYFHFDRPDYRPRTTHLVRTWKHRARHYARACAEKYPRLIEHMTTVDTARDVDRIRQALGVSRVSYYGFSYGTYLGEVYATLFPAHLRRMVLDSTVDPRTAWYRANLDQDKPFDRNITTWFGWVAKYDSTYHLGSTTKAVRNRWYAVLDRLARRPAGGKLGPAEWTDAFLWAGYYQSTWTTLARRFAAFVHEGNWRAVASFYRSYNEPDDDNGYAVYLAVQCTDAPWPQRWRRWREDSERIAAKAPFLTWDNTWFNLPCLYWHAPARSRLVVDGSGARSVLMIDETRDAATPYEGSLAVRRMFPNASLIAEPGGTTHAGSLSGNGCVDNRIARYLASGHRPPRKDWNGPDYVCQPLPQPTPSG